MTGAKAQKINDVLDQADKEGDTVTLKIVGGYLRVRSGEGTVWDFSLVLGVLVLIVALLVNLAKIGFRLTKGRSVSEGIEFTRNEPQPV